MLQSEALKYGTGILFSIIVSGMACSHFVFNGIYAGAKVRVAVCNLIYRKVCILQCTSAIDSMSTVNIDVKNLHVFWEKNVQ